MWYKVSGKAGASIKGARSPDLHLQLFNHRCTPTSFAPGYWRGMLRTDLRLLCHSQNWQKAAFLDSKNLGNIHHSGLRQLIFFSLAGGIVE